MLKATSEYLKSRGLTGPTVVIDETRARANIRAMAAKARASSVVFRPHFKTHQSPRVARWFADEGVDRITVSSVRMAEQFAETGWNDITIAFLLNPLEAPRITDLAAHLRRKGGRLGVTVDSVVAARIAAELDVAVWVKIDTGYGRTGIRWDDAEHLSAVLDLIDQPAGLLSHTGHSYAARGRTELEKIHREAVQRMTAAGRGLPLSLGDTPCCSAVDAFDGIAEIRPGNFVFYDLMQLQIGSCDENQIAAAAVCPVVGIYPERNQVVVQGGAVHLSKESLNTVDRVIFGRLGHLVLPLAGQAAGLGGVLENAPVVSLSQEHGIIDVPADLIGQVGIGDLLIVWPIHSCLMCDLHQEHTICFL